MRRHSAWEGTDKCLCYGTLDKSFCEHCTGCVSQWCALGLWKLDKYLLSMMCSPHPAQRFNQAEVDLQPTAGLSGLIQPSTQLLEYGILSLFPNTRQSYFACGVLFSVCVVSGSLYLLHWSLQILPVERQRVEVSKLYAHAISLHLCNVFAPELRVVWKDIHGRSGSYPLKHVPMNWFCEPESSSSWASSCLSTFNNETTLEIVFHVIY